MCCNGVERRNVVQAKLSKCGLKNLNSRCGVRGVSRDRIRSRVRRGGVYGFDDFVDLRGDKGI